MRGLAGLLLAALLCAPGGCASLRRDQAKDEIVRLEQELAASIGRGDPSVMTRAFADDAQWILPDGTVLSKAQAIERVAGGQAPYLHLRSSEVEVRLFGATATARGVDRWERVEDGRRHAGRVIWSDTWRRRDGQWRIVQVQGTELRDR